MIVSLVMYEVRYLNKINVIFIMICVIYNVFKITNVFVAIRPTKIIGRKITVALWFMSPET